MTTNVERTNKPDIVEPSARTPRSTKLRHGLALILGAGVPYAFLIYESSRTQHATESLTASLTASITAGTSSAILLASAFYLLCWGGWLLFFLRIVSREKIASLQQRAGSWSSDIRDGILLCTVNIVISGCVNKLLYTLADHSQSSVQQSMASATSVNLPAMLATLLYNWTAAAFFEETLRVFCITRILKFGSTAFLTTLAVTVSTILFACYHLHYGLHGAAVIAISGLLYAGYYTYRGRLSSLIIAHGLYGTYAWLASWYYYS